MHKPVIVCDIDDVLFPFIEGIADHHNDLHGTKLSVEDFKSYDFSEVWGGTQVEADVIIDSFLYKDNLELVPVPGADEALAELSKDYRVVLVTARSDVFSEKTAGWLSRHLPDLFEDVVFAGNPYNGRGFRKKGEICKELGAVLIIDDLPRNVLSAVEYGVDGILFGKHAWTTQAEGHDQIKHCKDWKEVVAYVSGDWRRSKL